MPRQTLGSEVVVQSHPNRQGNISGRLLLPKGKVSGTPIKEVRRQNGNARGYEYALHEVQGPFC